jgi:hypothetical protein
MSWEMNDKEFESVSMLDNEKRYEYFVSRVSDWEEVWSLASSDGDWALATDDDGTEVVPVWPHERFAAACADGDWANDEPRSITLDQWMERWLPGIARDKRLIAVFPLPGGEGVRVAAERLQKDLETANEQY